MISSPFGYYGTNIVSYCLNRSPFEERDATLSEMNDICRAKKIAHHLIDAANQNESRCESDTCLLLYSIIRDCGYRIIRIMGDDYPDQSEC